MDPILGIVLGFLIGGIAFGLIAWQFALRQSKAELSGTLLREREELQKEATKREEELADDAQRIWHFLQHELQQVAAAVRLMLDRLEPSVTDGPGQETIKQLRGQFQLFSDLTNACRTYAEFLESGTAHRQLVPISKLLLEVQKALLSYYPECKIELHVNELTSPLKVNANPDQMWVIFRNLLDNAWKYSSKERPVRVDAHSYKDEVVIGVSNVGEGLDNETMAQILRVGGRGNRDLKIPGRGLGLYYTNRIAQANGGTLTHEKQPHGQLMRVVLPAAQDIEPDFAASHTEPP